MKTIAIILILMSILALQCEKADLSANPKLAGEWVVKEVFLGDAIDTPCGYANTSSPELTIKFSADKNADGTYSFSGKSAVNQYFGSYEVTSFEGSINVGTIKLGPIGSTKMAGPQPLMDCEMRFFTLLEQSSDFSVLNENGKDVLRIGRFKKDPTPSRDGGTFLICERR